MTLKFINPEALGAPNGFSHGVLTDRGPRLLFIAGQIACDNNQTIISDDFVEQFDRALANVISVVVEAGGSAEQIARLIIYVTDKQEYRQRSVCAVYQRFQESALGHRRGCYPGAQLRQVPEVSA